MKNKICGYYFITDAALSRNGNSSDVKEAIKAGVTVVQYRNKDADTKTMYEEALKLKAICEKGGSLFLINDRIDIALAVGADGVHIGSEDMPYRAARKLLGKRKIIGMTVHNIKEAKQAQLMGADYIGLSPIFATTTKSDAGAPSGAGLIRKIKQVIALPIVAIGGITLENAGQVVAAGADSLCAISAVVTKKEPRLEILKFQRLFQ